MRNLVLLLSHLGAAVVALHLGFLYSLQQHAQVMEDCAKHKSPDYLIVERVPQQQSPNHNESPLSARVFLPTMRDLLVGGVLVPRDDFRDKFDLGFPLGEHTAGHNSHVLLLYQSHDSLPSNYSSMLSLNQSSSSSIFPTMHSLDDALENCETLKHVSMPYMNGPKHRNAQTCTALVGQTEADYVVKWVQLQQKQQQQAQGSINNKRPKIYFESSSRYSYGSHEESNFVQTVPNYHRTIQPSLGILQNYLSVLPDALDRLRVVAQQVADAGSDTVKNNLFVMVTNLGHAELFINFVCAARRVNLDLSKVLVFATDHDTYELVRAMNVAAFYDEQVFASIPRDSSAKYGDLQYGKIMMSKVYCAHLMSLLSEKYNFLFQDVDIIPYTSQYLEWFVDLSKQQPEYDLFFQNDHNFRAEYSPYVTNSGCYYVVNNARTRHFFADFVKRGDAVAKAKSHQAAMSGLLTEHVNLYGLRPKTLWGDHEVLLIGWHFHRNGDNVMKDLIRSNKTSALSMHMNWNSHKEEKRPFLEQMGDWYLFEPCVGDKTLADIEKNTSRKGDLVATCCSATPLYKCHFKDKPSLLPCESNKTHAAKSKKSFW
ncbi:hypothetical protein MPSEU_000926900 [Mayamaea pseudoterrestris]|nr:hypothetical protein MPSEU_000926900 [Mayamaea pseudoterrestris]